MTRAMVRIILAAAVVCSTAVVSQAQQTTTSTENKTFEVVAVDGNQLGVRLPEGTRELTVADDFRFTVNGKPLSVRELKPGMKGSATITTKTTTTPVTVTEVRNGTVVQATAVSITVKTQDGAYRMFTQGDVDKRALRIMRDGKPAQVSEFRPNDRISAVIITPGPPKVVTEKEVNATLATPTGMVGGGAARSSAAPAPAKAGAAAAPAGTAPRTLPKTASSWPTLGLASVLLLAMGLALTVRRRFAR
jgi:hypothetical protein